MSSITRHCCSHHHHPAPWDYSAACTRPWGWFPAQYSLNYFFRIPPPPTRCYCVALALNSVWWYEYFKEFLKIHIFIGVYTWEQERQRQRDTERDTLKGHKRASNPPGDGVKGGSNLVLATKFWSSTRAASTLLTRRAISPVSVYFKDTLEP